MDTDSLEKEDGYTWRIAFLIKYIGTPFLKGCVFFIGVTPPLA